MNNFSKKQENLDELRHSAAHLLAASVLEFYPEAKPTIGPSIKDGFYYDFDNLDIGEEDLKKIEAKMAELVENWASFERIEVSAEEAKNHFQDNPYKIELIEEFEEEGEQISFYKSGDFIDLCRGGHIENPSEELKHFKLLSTAGAYWRGTEENKMLTRIYGTAWPSEEGLDKYLKQQEEAKKRDHKKLGPQLGLFIFDETAPGSPYWLPKGMVILNELFKFWREEHAKRGYKETSTPVVNKKELWETSGHWEHYKDEMFIADMGENEVYGVKPMNCPNAMVIFGAKTRSYRDLPLRYSDADILHRYERSGTLNGLLRVRSFRQDDSHNFVAEEQIEQEYKEILEIADLFYEVFGLQYSLRLGTRPEGFLGDIEVWNRAEESLRKILREEVGEEDYEVAEGEGAFYGPKIDIMMKDSLGRDWQMGTIQLDFQQPKRFDLKYTDKDGEEKTPVVIHRVVYGSIERFIGILIEHFAGAFPVWISPVQVNALTISEDNLEYAEEVASELEKEGIRVEVRGGSGTLGNKIRIAQEKKTPYMLIIGDKEEEEEKVSLRLRTEEDLGLKELEEVKRIILDKIEAKSLDLI